MLLKSHRQCAKTQHECTRMCSSHDNLIVSLYKRKTRGIIIQSSSRHGATYNGLRCATQAQYTAAINTHDDVNAVHSETTCNRKVFLNPKWIFLHKVDLTIAFVLIQVWVHFGLFIVFFKLKKHVIIIYYTTWMILS